MLRRALLCTALAWQAFAAGTVVREVAGGRVFGHDPLPLLDKGYLFFLRPSSPELSLYDPNGQLVFNAVAQGPQGQRVHLNSAAIDTNGTVVATASYDGAPHGYGGALIFLDRSGKQTRAFTTDRYTPVHVCFGSDHSVWTLGWQRDAADNQREDREDYSLVRKYSAGGKELGAWMRRSSFPPGIAPGSAALGPWGIRAVQDRIGLRVHPGNVAGNPEWIELDLNGNLIGRWPLGRDTGGGTAFTRDARLYTLFARPTGKALRWRLAVFDRATSSWRETEDVSEAAEQGFLLGADGDNLVFARYNGRSLVWFAPAR
jgi:hypothetical protein